jgi:hypothetical protein
LRDENCVVDRIEAAPVVQAGPANNNRFRHGASIFLARRQIRQTDEPLADRGAQ